MEKQEKKVINVYGDIMYNQLCSAVNRWDINFLLKKEEYIELIDEPFLSLYFKSSSARLDNVPDELLTERMLRYALERDSRILRTLSVERRTPRRYEIAAEYGYCDNHAPQYIRDIFSSNRVKEYADEHIKERRYARLYNTAKFGEFYLYKLLRDNDYKSLMDEEILDLYIEKYSVRLDNIPDEFLTEEVLRRVFEKNNEALKTLPVEKRTIRMREIAAEYGYCDEESPKHIKEIFEEKKKLTDEQNKLKNVKNKIVDYEKIIINYINSSCNNIEEFCEKSLFYKALEYVEEYNTELYDCYKEFANIKEKEGFDYINEIISKMLELYKKDYVQDKSSSKNNFNVVNYFLMTTFDPKKMLIILKYWQGISPIFVQKFSQKIVKNSKTNTIELDAYKNTKYIFTNGILPEDKKDDIVNFLINNDVPINTVSLGYVSSCFMSNQIDLNQIYEKIHYDTNNIKRSEIREKSKIIIQQVDTIASLDAMINSLSEQKENLDSQIKGAKK